MSTTRPSNPLLRMSLRTRIVGITAVVMTAVFAVGGLLNILAVRAEFIHAADVIGLERAEQLAGMVQHGSLVTELPVDDEIEAVIQVVRGGRVVSGTTNAVHLPAFPLPALPPGRHRVLSVDSLPSIRVVGPFRTTVLGTSSPSGPATIFVAVSTGDIEDITRSAIRDGAIALALLILPLVGVLWFAVGRALAPVEAIRERAEVITGRRLDQRVPEPAQLDEIGRLARTINEMLARLDESAERQRRFLADAAHELRSPIASLRAQLETIQENEDATLARGQVPDLLADTLRMQTIADQLLLLERSDAGIAGGQRVPVDLDDVVDVVVTSCRLEDRQNHVSIDQSAVYPVQVTGDPGLLEQVVRNLVDNAVDHAATQVRVGLTSLDTQAVLTVDDDGPGIPPEHREDVFMRFTRLDESRDRRRGGVGLGLAIVAGIVNAHGGSVRAEDSPAGGARLTVTLPHADG